MFGAGKPPPADYQFLAVDGGATDNEPIGLARTALCGVGNRNPRDPAKANRGVLLVDPFAGEPGMVAPAPDDLLAVSAGVLNSLIQQTRYETSDLVLAVDPDVFSRFMISACRDGLFGAKAIATGGLGAFIGFASCAMTTCSAGRIARRFWPNPSCQAPTIRSCRAAGPKRLCS